MGWPGQASCLRLSPTSSPAKAGHSAFGKTSAIKSLLNEAKGSSNLDRRWLVGALLTIGDALAKHSYFDHAPELELLRHLRNGVAHGNTFRINLKLLAKFPAHNRLAWVRSDSKAEFEITPNLQNQPVLFDFMGPGDIIHLLMLVGLYLIRMGNGDALRP